MDSNVLTVQSTTNYEQFTLLAANRDISQGHVDRLSRSFEENGNLTNVQPILVNERLEVIDGQHRLEVCKLRGEAVFYTQAPGLTVADARNLNIVHRTWTPSDYAKSYAESGNRNYRQYIQLRDEYEVPHKILMAAIFNERGSEGIYKDFREGNMVISDPARTEEILNVYGSVKELTGIREPSFYAALFKVMRVPGYTHQQMLRKLAQHAEHLYKPLTGLDDNLRQLEDIYNYKQIEGRRLRLY